MIDGSGKEGGRLDIKVNQAQMVTQVPDTVTTETGDGTFKFTLAIFVLDATSARRSGEGGQSVIGHYVSGEPDRGTYGHP